MIDLGCVGHSVDRIGRPGWLHSLVAEAADECLGIDIHAAGIERMQELGYSAMVHDITTDPAPVITGGLFDVVICGEIIEHIEDLGVLFRFARSVLEPGGVMLVTTPNPYAPWRVRAGQLGLVTENCDHICLVHPSGMAELCDRMNLRLEAAWSAEWKAMAPATIHQSVHTWAAMLRDTVVARRGSGPTERALGWSYLSPIDLLALRGRRARHWISETALYVVRIDEPYQPNPQELARFSQRSGRLR